MNRSVVWLGSWARVNVTAGFVVYVPFHRWAASVATGGLSKVGTISLGAIWAI